MAIDLTHKIILEEKINWTGSILMGPKNADYIDNDLLGSFEMDRNLKDDSFNLVATGKAMKSNVYTEKAGFSANNVPAEGAIIAENNNGQYTYAAHRDMFKNIELAKTTELGVSVTNNNKLYYTAVVFPEIITMNKNITLKEGDYLELRSINSVKWSKIKSSNTGYQSSIRLGIPEVTYNQTYLVPRRFSTTTGNKTLFDIYTENLDSDGKPSSTSTFADYSKEDGKVLASSLNKTGLKTHFQPMSQDSGIQILAGSNALKVGEIQVYDSQYYDYDSNKIETGYGANSEEGLLVPYDFSGEYKEQVQISPNSAFKDLNINISHLIDQPLLNKYDGKIQLSIKETDETAGPYKIIPSNKIELLTDNDPSVKGLERISFEENL